MADPVSLVSSIITLLGTAHCIAKTLSIANSLRSAPAEVLALQNEISDLCLVLHDLERSVTHSLGMATEIPPCIQHLTTLINGAKRDLLELDEIVHYKIVMRSSQDGELDMSRLEWIRMKPAIKRIRQGIRETRLNLIAQMMILQS